MVIALASVYGIGWLYTWWYSARKEFTNEREPYRDIKNGGEVLLLLIALTCYIIFTAAWPINLAVMKSNEALKNGWDGSGDILKKMFPPIETKEEKRARIEKVLAEEEIVSQAKINDRERELGMELTTWQ